MKTTSLTIKPSAAPSKRSARNTNTAEWSPPIDKWDGVPFTDLDVDWSTPLGVAIHAQLDDLT